MQTLSSNATSGSTERSLRYLVRRLANRSDTRPLAGPVEAALANLRRAHSAWEDALDARVGATVELDYRDKLEGDAVMKLSRAVFALVDGNRRDPRWLALFPVSPGKVAGMHGALKAQATFARTLVDTLKSGPAYADLAAEFVPLLEECRKEVDAATSRRDLAETLLRQAASERQRALADAVLAHNNAGLHLQLMFPGQKPLVATFFRPRKAATTEEESNHEIETSTVG